MVMSDYVLSKFLKEEEKDMVTGITLASDAVILILKENVSTAMNKFNVSNRKEISKGDVNGSVWCFRKFRKF